MGIDFDVRYKWCVCLECVFVKNNEVKLKGI